MRNPQVENFLFASFLKHLQENEGMNIHTNENGYSYISSEYDTSIEEASVNLDNIDYFHDINMTGFTQHLQKKIQNHDYTPLTIEEIASFNDSHAIAFAQDELNDFLEYERDEGFTLPSRFMSYVQTLSIDPYEMYEYNVGKETHQIRGDEIYDFLEYNDVKNMYAEDSEFFEEILNDSSRVFNIDIEKIYYTTLEIEDSVQKATFIMTITDQLGSNLEDNPLNKIAHFSDNKLTGSELNDDLKKFDNQKIHTTGLMRLYNQMNIDLESISDIETINENKDTISFPKSKAEQDTAIMDNSANVPHYVIEMDIETLYSLKMLSEVAHLYETTKYPNFNELEFKDNPLKTHLHKLAAKIAKDSELTENDVFVNIINMIPKEVSDIGIQLNNPTVAVLNKNTEFFKVEFLDEVKQIPATLQLPISALDFNSLVDPVMYEIQNLEKINIFDESFKIKNDSNFVPKVSADVENGNTALAFTRGFELEQEFQNKFQSNIQYDNQNTSRLNLR